MISPAEASPNEPRKKSLMGRYGRLSPLARNPNKPSKRDLLKSIELYKQVPSSEIFGGRY